MKASEILKALNLPQNASVNKRIPKALLVEKGASASGDKRRINEGIEVLNWTYALKSNTVGISEYRDKTREYLEIAVIEANYRGKAKINRLNELIHRAIPYPVFLISTLSEEATISLAHKRWSQGEIGVMVLDSEIHSIEFHKNIKPNIRSLFLKSISIDQQPQTNIYDLYQGWIEKVIALSAALITGEFTIAKNRKLAVLQHEALGECIRLKAEISRLRNIAAKEKQIPKLVYINLEIKELETELETQRMKL